MEKFNAQVEIVTLPSKLLGREVNYCAVLPKSYKKDSDKFPVLYLLHGLFGRFDSWVTNTNLLEHAYDLPFIIICSEGGDNWYSDVQEKNNHRYESYIFQELIPDAEAKFNIGQARGSRAVAGLSMGGYGAFKFAFRQPEMFCFTASMSGAFHGTEIYDDEAGNFWTELKPSILEVFGKENSQSRKLNDLLTIVKNYPEEKISDLPFLYFDCGEEDSFLPFNINLASLFRERQIAHKFEVFPGGHEWDYWDKQIVFILNILSSKFFVQD